MHLHFAVMKVPGLLLIPFLFMVQLEVAIKLLDADAESSIIQSRLKIGSKSNQGGLVFFPQPDFIIENLPAAVGTPVDVVELATAQVGPQDRTFRYSYQPLINMAPCALPVPFRIMI
jgi:hypothetical protein